MREQKQSIQQELLKISTLHLQFTSPQQTVRSLILKNTHTKNALIYKIKTNNLQALEATPNFGFVRANTAISLRIKAIAKSFDAKLLISYANAGERPGEFNEVWTALRSEDVRSKQVRVWRLDQAENQRGNKQVDPKIYGEMFSSIAQRSQSQQKIKKNYISKQSAEVLQNDLANSIFDLQQKLNQQQVITAKLKQKLEITEDKLKQINQQRLQIKVNKSIGIICEDYHTSFTTLLLYGLAVFVFGYVLAKWES